MIDPYVATAVIVGLIVVFGIVLPVLSIRFPDYVSYRWCVVVVMLAVLVGAVVDFAPLSDETRRTLIVGTLIVAGAYVVLRTAEKALAKGWLRGASIEAQKGDISVKIHADDDKPPE